MRRVVLWTLLGIAGLVVALPLALFAVLHAPPFEPLRRAWAASLLGGALGLEADVAGPISVGPGLDPTISLSDITAERGDLDSSVKSVSAKRLEFNVPLLRLLLADVQLHALNVERLEVNIDIQQAKDDGEPSDEGLQEFIRDFARLSYADDLYIRDLQVHYNDEETGFVIDYDFEHIGTSRGPGAEVLITGVGRINGDPLTIDGKIDRDHVARTSRFTITASQTSLESTLAGIYRFGDPKDEIEATLQAKSPAIAQLLSVYGIKHDLDGSGEITLPLAGPLDALKTTGLMLRMAFKRGDKVEITGSIGDLIAGTGIELSVGASLAQSVTKSGNAQPFYNLGVTGFSGRIAGSLDGLIVRDLHIDTDSVDADLREIGPVTAERVFKNKEGQLGVYDILVLAGDPKDPSVRAEGTITDILALKGVTFKGDINLNAADFLDLAAERNQDKLGHLKGNVAISDTDGTIGLDALDASVSDSDLLALSVKLVFDDFSHQSEIELATKLGIPNFRRFALALGSEVGDLGPVKFDGSVKAGAGALRAIGAGLVGQTAIELALSGSFQQGHPELSGDIGTPLLHLNDLWKLASIRTVYLENVDEKDADVFKYNDAAWDKLAVALGVKVARIAGGGSGTSNIQGKVTYAEGVVGLEPLSMTFLGGKVTTSGTIRTKEQDRFSMKGKVTNLDIDAILKEMEIVYPVAGTLHVDFNINGEGATKKTAFNTLGGNATIALQPGWIGNGLLDLTALSLPAWLMTSSKRGSGTDIACVNAPFSFRQGRGTTRSLVFETRNVQAVGAGFIDFPKDQIDLRFRPRALQVQLLKVVQPFAIQGKLSDPTVRLTGAPVMGAAVDVLSMPLNLVGQMILPRPGGAGRAPCQPITASG